MRFLGRKLTSFEGFAYGPKPWLGWYAFFGAKTDVRLEDQRSLDLDR